MKPKLNKDLLVEEFNDYYFLKEELISFCREEGLKVSGNKSDLEERIRYYLSTGKKLDNTKIISRKSHENITVDTIIGENFVCSQEARKFFIDKIGPTFKFKVSFQKWLKNNPKKTFAEAIIAYQDINKILKDTPTTIDKQFQYNQYIRDFFSNNPEKHLEDAIKCWNYKKSLPGTCKYEDSDLIIFDKYSE